MKKFITPKTLALGTLALGTLALGTLALGTLALGTLALGTLALGTLALGVVLCVLGTPIADACSRVLWNNNGKSVVTGRSMDWSHKFDDYLFVVPRGVKMDGGTDGGAEWTSRYGSVVSSISGYASAHRLLAI